MGTPILHTSSPHRSLDLAPVFPAPGWAVHARSGLDRAGDVVTLGLMARPLLDQPDPPGVLPEWARPTAPVLVNLTVPSTGTVVARLLIDTYGTIFQYGAVASGTWAYASTSWRAYRPW